MKLVSLGKAPREMGGECTTATFAEYEIKNLEDRGIEEAYYWYEQGCYEGSGYMIFRAGDKWYTKSMSHCSCYGPLEDLAFDKPYASPRDILENCSKEYREEVEPLVLLAEKS